jgi:hypothetical protein
VPDILPGFLFERNIARYRDTSTGRFVARSRITSLMENQVATSEHRMAQIVQGVADKSIAPGVAQEALRDEMRRLSLANRALGAGGIEELNFRDYGAVGRQLRDTYERIGNLVTDVEEGNVSLPQALNRIQGYAGDARRQFFQATTVALQVASASRGVVTLMIRDLGAAEHCDDCVNYYEQGYQFDLPAPGDGSVCNSHCRCNLRFREVPMNEAQELIGTR